MISEAIPATTSTELKRGSLRQRVLSGTAVGCFGALVVVLGGWWFTAAVGVIVHLGLLEFFRTVSYTHLTLPTILRV